MLPDSRACTKCGLDKPLSEFSKAPRGKYGVKASCKACDAERYAANPTPSRALPREELQRRLAERRGDSKTCTRCGETKPYAEFSLSRSATETRSAVYRPWCKVCQAEAARQWYRDNTDRARENRRRHQLSSTYGITQGDYDALLAEQGGVCAICGQDEPAAHGRTGEKFALSVDHCHDTGRVRGLLCQKCNRAIGLLGDDVDLLKKAIYYLERGSGHNQ